MAKKQSKKKASKRGSARAKAAARAHAAAPTAKTTTKPAKRVPLKNKGRPESDQQKKRRLNRNKVRRDTRSALKEARGKVQEAANARKAAQLLAAKPRETPKGKITFEPSAEQRTNVSMLAGFGMSHDQIAIVTIDDRTGEPISTKSLERHFKYELASGPSIVGAKVAQSLFKKAMGNGAGAVSAGIWWTKCRMGWKEKTIVEIESKSGVLISPAAMTPEEWVRAAAKRAATATEPGRKDDDE